MRWNEVLGNLTVLASGGEDANPDIVDVTCDSRSVSVGSLYVSIPGLKQHGDTFIADAVARGAAAVLSENAQPGCVVPWAQIANTRKLLGIVSRLVWRVDESRMLFVGITGTNGKTTTAYLFQNLFAELFGKHASWMFGTVKYATGDSTTQAQRTTPESSDIFRAIGGAGVKPKAVVMEVSSHALALDRVAGLSFDCAVWTNLTQDHLDFHASLEQYYQAKKRLFFEFLSERGSAVINIDDPWGNRLSREVDRAKRITYGKANAADVRIERWETSWDGTWVDVRIGSETLRFGSALSGQFNVYNMTALVAGAYALSIDTATVRRSLETMSGVPGRMERVPLKAGFSVFVDYAHTPDALINVLTAARELTKGRLICVFGCGGDRDKGKRPLMAAAVARHCDEAVVTSDNPRSEDPDAIMRDILRGMPLDFPHAAIADRREAIRKALRLARPGDCVIVAGKGHENYQEVKGVRRHFDDRETVLELVAELEANHAGA